MTDSRPSLLLNTYRWLRAAGLSVKSARISALVAAGYEIKLHIQYWMNR